MTFPEASWTLVGALAAVIAVPVAVVLWLLGRPRRSISYESFSNIALLSPHAEQVGDIRLLYKGNLAQKVRIVELAIHNNGNQPVTTGEVEEPITICPKTGRILNVEIGGTVPLSLHPEVKVQNNGVVLRPQLFNPNELIVLKILTADSDGTFDITARIVGMSELERSPVKLRARVISGSFAGLAVIAGLYFAALGVVAPAPSVAADLGQRATYVLVGAFILLPSVPAMFANWKPHGSAGETQARERSRALRAKK